MIALAWVISLIVAGYLGYRFRELQVAVSNIKELLAAKVDKKPKEERKSMIIDPDDPVQRAKLEHEQMMERLNP